MNDANNAGIEPGPCPKCGCDSYVVGEPYWKHDDQWTAAAYVTCDKCDHEWDVALTLSTPNAPVEREAIDRAIGIFLDDTDWLRSGLGIEDKRRRMADAILAVRLDEAAIRKDEREKCAAIVEAEPLHYSAKRQRLVSASAIRNGGKQL